MDAVLKKKKQACRPFTARMPKLKAFLGCFVPAPLSTKELALQRIACIERPDPVAAASVAADDVIDSQLRCRLIVRSCASNIVALSSEDVSRTTLRWSASP